MKPIDKGAMLVVEEKEKEVTKMFMAHSEREKGSNSVLIIDSGYSNHMTWLKKLTKTLDES